MNGVLEAVAVGAPRSDTPGSPSSPALEQQLQELEATIDARLAGYRRRERLRRSASVPASVGVAATVLWQLGAGLL